MIILYIFLFFISLFYALQFISYRFSWESIDSLNNYDYQDNNYFITVVIACRNEEDNLHNIIRCLQNQDFDNSRFEVIFVNDHSNDETLNILNNEAKKWSNLRVINMQNSYGKNKSIREGILNSQGDIILCTDADCLMSPKWISSIYNYFNIYSVVFVSSPVILEENKALFHKFILLEFISLIGSGASSIYQDKAIFCNGANIAFRKSMYLDICDSEFNNLFSDDSSLIRYVQKKYNDGICFAKNKECVVRTYSPRSFISFLRQRVRWLYSSTIDPDKEIFYLAYLVLIMNLSIFLLFVLPFFYYQYIFIVLFLILFLIKCIVDFIFLQPLLSFFNKKYLLIYLIPFEIIYSFYTILIVTLLLTLSPKWKGRILHEK